MKLGLKTARVAVAMALVSIAGSAPAWDGAVVGVIGAIHSVPNAGNYDFRINFKGQSPQFCTSTNPNALGWAALHSTDANFKGVQATLMLAYAMQKHVTVYSMTDGSGYCKIGYVVVNDG